MATEDFNFDRERQSYEDEQDFRRAECATLNQEQLREFFEEVRDIMEAMDG